MPSFGVRQAWPVGVCRRLVWLGRSGRHLPGQTARDCGREFGASAAGGVFVPINHILKAPQVGYILRDCDVRVLVTSRDRLDLLGEELNSCNFLEHVVLVDAHDNSPLTGTDIGCMLGLTHAERADSGHRRCCRPSTSTCARSCTPLSTSQGRCAQSPHPIVEQRVSFITYRTARRRDLVSTAAQFRCWIQPARCIRRQAHVILLNYLLPGDLVKLCAAHKVTGLTCVPPPGFRSLILSGPLRLPSICATSRIPEGGCRRPPSIGSEDLSAGSSISDVWPDRGVQIDLSGSRPGRQAT